jgi:hypothetical protein
MLSETLFPNASSIVVGMDSHPKSPIGSLPG